MIIAWGTYADHAQLIVIVCQSRNIDVIVVLFNESITKEKIYTRNIL